MRTSALDQIPAQLKNAVLFFCIQKLYYLALCQPESLLEGKNASFKQENISKACSPTERPSRLKFE